MIIFSFHKQFLFCLVMTAFAVCCLPACGKQEKQTLRDVEELAEDWLVSLGEILAPVKPEPPKTDNKSAKKKTVSKKKKYIRDCFVDDGWDPQGFKNPTEAIVWLNEDSWRVGKILSIEQAEDGAMIIFELAGKKKVQVEACITLENDAPKCKWLKVASAVPG